MLESVLYQMAFKKQNVLLERARTERTYTAFPETLNYYAGTSEQNGHMKETSKAAAYSYSQVDSKQCFISFPPMDINYECLMCVMLQINTKIER